MRAREYQSIPERKVPQKALQSHQRGVVGKTTGKHSGRRAGRTKHPLFSFPYFLVGNMKIYENKD